MNVFDIKIGNIINPDMGIQIANYFGMEDIVRRIEAQPEMYDYFIFDGCSCLPDELLGLFTGCKWRDITYLCCLPHDIAYAYGETGDDREKEVADKLFEENLIKKAGMNSWTAKVFLAAVKIGGTEEFGLSFSWGFANK